MRMRTMTDRRVVIGVAAGLLLMAGAAMIAQEPQGRGRGRGEPAAPNPLGQPILDPTGHVKDDAVIHLPLAAADSKYADLDGKKMKAIVRELAAISDKNRDSGEVFWGRNVGTQGHVDTEDWTERYFRKNNLQNIQKKSFDLGPQWIPSKGWSVTFSSGGTPIALASARPAHGMPSTPAGGQTYELVWGGLGTEADLAGRDLKGKAVLIQDLLTPGVLNRWFNNEGVGDRAIKAGAAAVGIVYGIADNFALWEGVRSGAGFNVGYEDGKKLRDMLGRGEKVTVTLNVQAERKTGLKAASVLGTLPGTTDEDIWIIAHLDGYFEGALDNASGMAVMMGLLDHFAKVPQSDRKRAIRFMGSVGHHGGPGTAWLHDARATEFAKTALIINLEHVSADRTKYWGNHLRQSTGVSPMRWWVWGSQSLLDISLSSFNRFNVGITADMDNGASGEIGGIARDAPSIQVITSPEVKHTEQDTPEWVPSSGLEQIARAYARIIDELNKLDRRQILPAASRPSTAGGQR
jgi:Peptidase family M28